MSRLTMFSLAGALLLATPLATQATPLRPVAAAPLLQIESDLVTQVRRGPKHMRFHRMGRPPGWSRGRKVGWYKKGGPKWR